MKKEIMAAITTLINVNSRRRQSYMAIGLSTKPIESTIDELNDLQDYIADFKETELKENDEIETLNYENKMLKKTLQETTDNWKESYNRVALENMKYKEKWENDVKDILKIDKCRKIMEKDYQESQKCNEELKTTNIMWQTSCNNLKLQLEKLQGPQWKE